MTEEQMYDYLSASGYEPKYVDDTFTALCSEGNIVVLAPEQAIHITMKDGEPAVMAYGYADYAIERNAFGVLEMFKREAPKKKSNAGLGMLGALAGAMGGGMPPVINAETTDASGMEVDDEQSEA